MNDTVVAIEKYLRQLAPHQKEREAAQLLVAAKNELSAMQQRAEVAESLSVTKILLCVVPGLDGEGEDVYAKSVAEIEELLSSLSGQVEDYEFGIKIAPVIRQKLEAAEARIKASQEPVHTVSAYSQTALGLECKVGTKLYAAPVISQDVAKSDKLLLRYYRYVQNNKSDTDFDFDGVLAELDASAHVYLYDKGLLSSAPSPETDIDQEQRFK